MRVVTYPEKYDRKEGDIAVFLAGGISDCDNWQNVVIDYIKSHAESHYLDNLVILNPRGDESKILSFDEKQVWDFDNLNEADIVSFYFCKNATQSTSMYELGRHLALYGCGYHDKIVVSIESGFKKENVLNDQCQLLGIYPLCISSKKFTQRYYPHAEAIIAAYNEVMNDRVDSMLTGVLKKEMDKSINDEIAKVESPRPQRAMILEDARMAVCSDRNHQYGDPEDNFKTIADYWNDYLSGIKHRELTASDVADMMVLFKIARNTTAPHLKKSDNYVDIAGYAACGGEIAGKDEGMFSKVAPGTAVDKEEFKRRLLK